MEITLKDILNKFEDFVDSHKQLEEYGFGKPENITTKNFNYPLFWVIPANHSFTTNKIILRLNILVLTLLENELENLDFGLSDTLIILNDFLSYYFNNYHINKFKINDNVEINSYIDKNDDKLVGNSALIEIEVFNSLCDEIIPVN